MMGFEINGWLDLDIHINDDITKLVSQLSQKHNLHLELLNDFETMSLRPYGKEVRVMSIVRLCFGIKVKATWLREYTEEHWEKISLDL